MEELFLCYNCHVKCADMEEPIPIDTRPLGKHGTAILWNKKLSHLVTQHKDGSDRITVITLDCNPQPLCIVNAYLPAQGSKDFQYSYDCHLDQLFEIRQKFKDHIFVLAGDINASIVNPRYPHDFKAKKALEELQIYLHGGYPLAHTFYSHNGRSSRQIDYILSSHPEIISVDKPIQLPHNTSAHLPITAKLEVTFYIPNDGTSQHDHQESSTNTKIKWDKVDKCAYKQYICVLN